MNAERSLPLARLRAFLTRVCPATICERVVDQALADLAIERARHSSRFARLTVTISGLFRLAAALALSLVVLRRHWRRAPWLGPVKLTREAAGWIALVTLLTVLRVAFMRHEGNRLRALSPDFTVMTLVPIALPAAMTALVLVEASRRRLTSLALAATGATLVSVTCSMALPATLQAIFNPGPRVVETGGNLVLVDGRPIERHAWERFQSMRTRASRYHRHLMLSTATFCLTLPALGVALVSLLRRTVPQLVALACAAVTMALLLEWRNSAPAPMTLLPEAIVGAWLPHAALVGATAIAGAAAWLRYRVGEAETS